MGNRMNTLELNALGIFRDCFRDCSNLMCTFQLNFLLRICSSKGFKFLMLLNASKHYLLASGRFLIDAALEGWLIIFSIDVDTRSLLFLYRSCKRK